MFKSTIFPNKKVKGLAYIKELPGFISTPNGNFSTSGIKIIGVGINIKFGGNSHSISFKMPQSWLAAPPSSAIFFVEMVVDLDSPWENYP